MDKYEKAARRRGWYINENGNFETVIGTDTPDEVTTFSPTDPDGGWATLCDAEGIAVDHDDALDVGGDYKGFVVTRDGGPDAPWRAWHPDGIKYRADTLEGLLGLIDADRPGEED